MALFAKRKLKWALCFVIWDLLVPNITWLLLLVLVKSTANLGIVATASWLLPCLFGIKRIQKKLGALLRTVAKTRSLRVEPHPKAKVALSRSRPCLVGLHPHGACPLIIFPWIASRPDLFANLTLAMSSLAKFVPSVGFVTMISPCKIIDVKKANIILNMQKGNHTAIFPGGARGMIECVPDMKLRTNAPNIRLVQRTGFLRIAYLSVNNRVVKDPLVVPCFLFGQQDAFFNPLSILDAWLYKLTGVNLPLWFPNITNLLTATPPTMVIGAPLDPRKYSSEEDFFAAYYTNLENLYETNKHRFPNYQERRIHWIEGNSSRKKDDKGKRIAAIIMLVTSIFLFLFVYKHMTTGWFWRFSTMQPFLDGFRKPLLIHIGSGTLWVVAFAIQVITPKNSWRRHIHKWIGSVAIIAFACLCTTGYSMTVQHLRDELDGALDVFEFDVSIAYPCFAILNAVVASTSNMYLICLNLGMMAISILALSKGDVRTHRVFMTKINGSFIMGIFPRFGAYLFRTLFQILCPTVISSPTSYSLSCVVLMIFNIKLLKAHRGSLRHVMWSLHKMSLFLTTVTLVLDICFQYPIVALSFFFVASLNAGLKQYHWLGPTESKNLE